MTSPKQFPDIDRAKLPAISTADMVEVDRLMIEEYGIRLLQVMENAGRNLADLAQALLEGDVQERPILVLAGRGGNGGGGMVAARHLANRGGDIQVVLAHPVDEFRGDPARQLDILLAMGVSVTMAGDGWELPSADLIIDALIGNGLSGAPRGATGNLIQLANSHPAPILALDAPSGLNVDTGQMYEPSIRATATLALALPQKGLYVHPEWVGELFLADISVPAVLYEDMDFECFPVFSASPILHIRT